MDTTPRSKIRKLSCRKTEPELGSEEAEPWAPSQPFVSTSCTSTPPNKKGIQFIHDNDSPMDFPLTQEGSEEMDVVWDWNSPQENKRKRQRRVLRPLSPIVPIKRHPSSSQTLEKLEMELRALREQLAESFDETLHVSPHQEDEILQSQNKVVVEDKELDLMLDDSLDEQLLQCTQQIESQFQVKKLNHVNDTGVSSRNNELEGSLFSTFQNETKKPSAFQRTRSNELYSKPQNKVEFNRTRSFEEPVKNSTFELPKDVLDQIEKKRLEALARLEAKRNNSVPAETLRFSQTQFKSKVPAKLEITNVKMSESTGRQDKGNNSNESYEEIGRKALQQSSSTFHPKFPISSSTIPFGGIAKRINESKCSLEEIEKKRQQALAKRQAVVTSVQTNAGTTPTNRIDTSAQQASMKCSPEEIEKKRLQAMARREEKKIQDLIERKRQEALKRLQFNRQKQNKHV